MSSQVHVHAYSFDVRTAQPSSFKRMPLPGLDDTPPYTPRSKSLDLLRCDSATPVTARTSLDTISTLKGQRISSPIFLNSSNGVKPLPEEPEQLDSPTEHEVEIDRRHGESHTSFTTKLIPPGAGHSKLRASTMPRYPIEAAVLESVLQPKTPSHRQKASEHLLKSKFSMSPVQPSKRSKTRNSEDCHAASATLQRVPEGIVSQDNARSALGNWSYSIGMAAKKLHKSAQPRKGSEESCIATLEVPRDAEDGQVTPEKCKNSLRSATSLASIRRFITPSRRTRKVSSTRGLAGSRRAMLTVDDVVMENFPTPSNGSGESAWIDADRRTSRDGLAEPKAANTEAGEISICSSLLTVPSVVERSSRTEQEQSVSVKATLQRRVRVPPEFYEPPSKASSSKQETVEGIADGHDEQEISITQTPSGHSVKSPNSIEDALAPEQENAAVAGSSRLKTLQLLARRPFSAFGKKMREMEKSWWPSRGVQDNASLLDAAPRPDQVEVTERLQATRRSEDLLARASPRIIDSTTMAQKSRSVELDRIQLPSKVVPIRSTGVANYKRRPTIPDAFAKSVPQPYVFTNATQSETQTPRSQPRISNFRHPWMKQLQLPAATRSGSSGSAVVAEPGPQQLWPKMDDEDPTSQRKIIPAMSLTAAGVALSQALPIAPNKLSPRRPPASLLEQSLPIPPRSGRSRASTISSQSSTTSSPSGKVIVSRRSYGQRLRSPSAREDTGSIRSVGTSILFAESPPNSPGMRKLMSPYQATRTPTATRIRSPPTTVLLPKYSPHRSAKAHNLHKKPSAAFTEDSEFGEEQEWMDEEPIGTRATNGDEHASLRSFPPKRPGFLEMNEATHTLSNLIKTFSGSSGSLSLHSSPYKKNETPDHHTVHTGTPRGLYGIMEADESGNTRTSPSYHLTSSARKRLISIASMVSTEANSSFEDSEELQKLLDSIMAADLGGGSYDSSGSRDMALLSPFGSPAEYRTSRSVDKRDSSEVKEKETPKLPNELPPPPKFLLNDRPISPPDSSCMSDNTHSNCSVASSAARTGAGSWPNKAPGMATHDDSGYVSVSVHDGGDLQSK